MSPLSDHHQYSSHYTPHSLPYSCNNVVNRPVSSIIESDNNVIYRIPEDYIDSNNYIKHNNILHTQLYGDTGMWLSFYYQELKSHYSH